MAMFSVKGLNFNLSLEQNEDHIICYYKIRIFLNTINLKDAPYFVKDRSPAQPK